MNQAFLSSLLLNNIGVHLLHIGHYKEGAWVLRNAVTAMTGHFRRSNHAEEKSRALPTGVDQAQKMLLSLPRRSKRASPCGIHIEILTYDTSIVPLVSLEADYVDLGVLRLVVFDLEGLCDSFEPDRPNETILVVSNLMASNILILQDLTVAGKGDAERLHHPCYKMMELARLLIQNASVQCDDDMSHLHLLIVSLLVSGDEVILHRQRGAPKRTDLVEKCDRILRNVRASPVFGWFNGRSLVGTPAA